MGQLGPKAKFGFLALGIGIFVVLVALNQIVAESFFSMP